METSESHEGGTSELSPLMVAPTVVSGTTGTQRIHYLDNLRALAMMLGVFLHAALAYADPAQSIWLATDTRSSISIDIAIWFIHLFRMSLFFFLSGYFAKLLMERKGVKGFLWNRTLRIAIPFLLSYPFLFVAMTVAIVFAISYLEEPKGLMGYIASGFRPDSAPKESKLPGTMHLWFLYYLIFFNFLGLLLSRFRWPVWRWLEDRSWLFLLAPLLLVPGILGGGIPLPAPDSFIPAWWPFVFYGLFYLAGWKLVGRESLLEVLSPYVWYLVAASIVLFVPYYRCMPVLNLADIIKGKTPFSGSLQVLESVLTAYLSVFLTLASLLLGKKYLSVKSQLLRFIADASYWVYLIHLPIVILLQTALIPLDCNVGLKLISVILGTVIVSLASYLVFVRYTPIGWLLNGKRSFP